MSRMSALDIAREYSASSVPEHRLNACIALGEIGGTEALSILAQKLDPNQESVRTVRRAAADAVCRLTEKEAAASALDPDRLVDFFGALAQERDPDLRQRTFKSFKTATHSSKWSTLKFKAERLEKDLYAWLGIARRQGVFRPAVEGGYRPRLHMAWQVQRPRALDLQLRIAPLFVALLLSCFSPLIIWVTIEILLRGKLAEGRFFSFYAIAALLAVTVSLVALSVARPVNLAADRLAGGFVEVAKAVGIGAILGTVIGAILSFGGTTAFGSLDGGASPAEAIFRAGVVLAITVGLIRAQTVSIYGIMRSSVGRSAVALIMVPATIIGLGALATDALQAFGQGLAAIVAIILFLPSAFALTVGYLLVDLGEFDAFPTDAPKWRWSLASAMAVPGVLVAGFLAWGQSGLTGSADLQAAIRQAGDGRVELAGRLELNRDYLFEIEADKPQSVRIKPPVDAAYTLLLRALTDEGRQPDLRSLPDGAHIAHLLPGDYSIRPRDPSRFAAGGLTLEEAASLLVARATRGRSWPGSQAVPSSIAALTFEFNTEGITEKDYERAKAVGADIKVEAERSTVDRSSVFSYWVVLDGSNQPFASGSLLVRLPKSELWLPAIAWPTTQDVPIEPKGLFRLESEPDLDRLDALKLINRVWTQPRQQEESRTIFGLALEAEAANDKSFEGLMGQLSRLRPASGTGGVYALYLGGDPGAAVGIGTLVRQTGTAEEDLLEVQIIGGRAAAAGAPLTMLRRSFLGELVDWPYDEARRLALEAQELSTDKDAFTAVIALPAAEVDSEVARILQSEVARILQSKGQWVEEFGIRTDADAPALFSHYFILAADGNSFELGTIVRGKTWDYSEWPEFELIFGQGPASGYEYLSNLTYLGAEEKPDWEVLAKALATGQAIARLPRQLSDAARELKDAQGLWQAAIDISADEPPEFRHFFALATDGNSFSAGSIVRGNNWDRSDWPGFELIYGWGPESGDFNWEYLSNLTYLGDTYDPAWEAIAREIQQATSGQKARGEPFRRFPAP